MFPNIGFLFGVTFACDRKFDYKYHTHFTTIRKMFLTHYIIMCCCKILYKNKFFSAEPAYNIRLVKFCF